jgi:NADH dehydrogenase FAD-containing subunit
VKKHILVLGGGFAGLWSAIAAARELSEQKAEAEAEITLIERTTYHNMAAAPVVQPPPEIDTKAHLEAGSAKTRFPRVSG